MAATSASGIPVRVVALAALGYAGGTMSIMLIFLGMRTVMDVGGYCAEGGPYVIAQGCPDAAVPSMFLGIFGLFAFGAIATAYGVRVGGLWAAAPLLGWSALFGLLGWNFMQYGVFAPPFGEIEWGWALCGIMFWLMAAGPLLALLPMGAALRSAPSDAMANRAARKAAKVPYEPDPSTGSIIRIVGPDGVQVVNADDPAARAQLAAIASAMGEAIETVAAETPMDPDAHPGAAPDADFDEGTQALLDRLERLADLRDRGLLEPAEYETAKDSIVRELEARQ